MPLSHHEAQEDLARWLRVRYQYKPVVVAEMALAGSYGDQGRIDVAAFWATCRYRKHLVYGYEVKVSRSDFLADLRAAKWRRYLSQVDRLFFALEDGVATPEEVPAEAGLLVHSVTPLGGSVWRQVRKAAQQVRVPDAALPWRLAFRLDRDRFERDAMLRENRWLRERNQQLLARVRELEGAGGDGPTEDAPHGPPPGVL